MKYQLFLQSRSAECGLACAAMILRRLGIDTDLHRLRTQYEVGRDGMSTTAIRFLLCPILPTQRAGPGHR